jgi:hypothetical protein
MNKLVINKAALVIKFLMELSRKFAGRRNGMTNKTGEPYPFEDAA